MEKIHTLWRFRYKIAKYIISGGTAAFVNLGTLHVLDTYTPLHYIVSVNIAFIFAFGFSFFLQKFWTFKDTATGTEATQQMVKYFIVSLCNLVLNSLLVVIFMETVVFKQSLAYYIQQILKFVTVYLVNIQEVVAAQFTAALIIAFVSYFIYQKFIFKQSTTTVYEDSDYHTKTQ